MKNANRIERLNEAKSELKKDFVGLDEIIDKIIDSITPWYLTPEILERPTVVSLWGLTGTGKTSLVRKLVNYLGISEKSLFFDCGEQGGESDMKLFSEKLDDLFESSQIQESDLRFYKEDLGINLESPKEQISKMDPLNYTFVFDEFQYLRTKNPGTGEEELRPEGRAIWSLMDSGLVDINRYHFKVKSLMEYIEDLEFFSDEHPRVAIKEGYFDKSMNTILKQQLSYYRWSDEYEDIVDETKDSNKGYNILLPEDLSFLARRLNILHKGLGFEVAEKINEMKTLSEFIHYIKKYISLISKPKVINCSKSLIFILGNLDEAFDLTGEDLDPDIDADVYHEMTSRVNCMDVKTALRSRFRDEQVGRMGNNLIVYPSLRRCDFEEIISREVLRITRKMKSTSGKDIIVTDELKKLIYSEGCFPIQGVRPLFSTINTILSPLLSMVVMMDEDSEYILDVGVGSTDFNVPKINIEARGRNTGERKVKEISLNLGALRSPDRCKKIGLQAIHEASHAVLYYILTGKTPSAIVASNVFGDGGYMMNAIDTDSSTESIQEHQNEIIVSLAGYYGEREFFTPDRCSLGASSDISRVWEKLRSAFYDSGLIIPLRFSESGVSGENEGRPFGFPGASNIDKTLMEYFNILCEKTKNLIHDEREAIREVAKELCKTRCLGIDVFKDIVEKWKYTEMDAPSDDYYTNTLLNDK